MPQTDLRPPTHVVVGPSRRREGPDRVLDVPSCLASSLHGGRPKPSRYLLACVVLRHDVLHELCETLRVRVAFRSQVAVTADLAPRVVGGLPVTGHEELFLVGGSGGGVWSGVVGCGVV